MNIDKFYINGKFITPHGEEKIDIVIDKSEHLQYEWLSRVKAAEKVFSHTNRQAIFDLI